MKWKKIGDILIVDNKFSEDSLDNLESIASEHNVKSIIKIDKIDGQKREPTISLLYGDETETIHKENGCLFNLDLSKVMWAKGNNNERLRIAKLVSKGESVVDMFAGIGYFSIPIGVHSQAEQIYSIEINLNSYHFLKKNIELNRINEKEVEYEHGYLVMFTPAWNLDKQYVTWKSVTMMSLLGLGLVGGIVYTILNYFI